MQFDRRQFAIAFVSLIMATPLPARADGASMSPKANRVLQVLDGMGVESRWIAGHRIDWQTGLPNGLPVSSIGQHTHCSAFVAAAAERLGVYILRPPEHPQDLLANAQFDWLAEAGVSDGWRPINGPVEAQAAANAGDLVVVAYHNHRDTKPGHIAIVRAGSKPQERLMAEGPDVIMASTINRSAISTRDGFASHPAAWGNREIRWYAHRVAAAN